MPKEIEIKFRIGDRRALARALRGAGFKLVTRSTHEMNSLYDVPGQKLRKRGELLRLRKYSDTFVLTHKAKGKAGRHKVRTELETRVENGTQMDAILRALGYAPTFRYEKSARSGATALDMRWWMRLRLESLASWRDRRGGLTVRRAR